MEMKIGTCEGYNNNLLVADNMMLCTNADINSARTPIQLVISQEIGTHHQLQPNNA
jgi:hypothetical protein